MAIVVHAFNPFDPLERETHTVRRPMTVRRFVSRRREMRRHTSVRRIPGGPQKGRRVREFNRATVCLYNGRPLLRSDWSRTVIRQGDQVLFYAAPAGGGGGGGGGSNPLMIVAAVAMIALAVAAPYLAPLLGPALFGGTAAGFAAGTLAGGLLSAGITLVGGLIISGVMSLFTPPPAAQANYNSGYGGSSAQSSPTYSLQAQGNSARLLQPIPVPYGRNMIYPDYVTQPYTRYVDNEQYIHALMALGQVLCDVEQLRIGDTPIESFSDITWEKIEPGGTPTLADPRWLVCTDIADIVVPDAGDDLAPSAWQGPFAANPPGTVVGNFEMDLVAPRGLFAFNGGGGFDARGFTVEVEAQPIDIAGVALSDWEPIHTITESKASNQPQRFTYAYDFSGAGRWQVRVRRTDAADTGVSSGDQVDWVGLRGYLASARTFAGVTLLAVKMKASGALNGQTSRQVNAITTTKLPTWDFAAGAMGTEPVPTRSICDAFADIARNPVYGARQPDSKIDLAGLYACKDELDGLGWTFDYVFDTSVRTRDALTSVALAAIGVPIVQGGRLRLVRDVPTTAPAMVFTPRNIKAGSWQTEYKMVDEETADSIIATIMDDRSWKPVDLTEAFEDSPQQNPTSMILKGITVRAQGREIVWNILRGNRYRRRAVGWNSEMEGLLLLRGDPVAISHDVPRWGQSTEAVAWDEDGRALTVADPVDFTGAETHYVLLRDHVGRAAGPFAATDGGSTGGVGVTRLVIGDGDLPEILTGGDRERTIVQFGPGETYAKRLKLLTMVPRSGTEATIVAVDDDPRMFDPIPPESPAPIGHSQDPIEVHVTEDTANVNLRTLANAAGYGGLMVQSVTVIIDEGVEVYSTNSTLPAAARGTWPAAYKPVLINNGTISGAGGSGTSGGDAHNFGTLVPTPATPGGTALDATSGPLSVDNTAGTIRGGGGGGGQGQTFQDQSLPIASGGGGGGGGGGQGRAGGLGGIGYGGLGGQGVTGGAGSAAAAGAGGAGYHLVDDDITAGHGGAGGAWGAVGTAGVNASQGPVLGGPYSFNGPYPAGAGGKAVAGNANISWVATGTRIGPVT